jgi:hypothetical protein
MTTIFSHATLERPGPISTDVRTPGKTDPGAKFSFEDLLDVLNPLQHIPIVSSIYRELTGDTIRAPARIFGGALFAGPVGAAASFVDAIIDETTGRDTGGHVFALFEDAPAVKTTVAKADPQQPAAKAAASGFSGPAVLAAPTVKVETARINAQGNGQGLSHGGEMDGAGLAPRQLASVEAAANYPRNQMPRELLEALYNMHREQYQQTGEPRETADQRL